MTLLARMTLLQLPLDYMLLKPAEVADQLRISIRTAQRLITANPHRPDRLRGIRVGRQLRVDEEEVRRYVRDRGEADIQARLPFQ